MTRMVPKRIENSNTGHSSTCRIIVIGSLVITLMIVCSLLASTEKTLTASTAVHYTIIDLGVLPGDDSSAATAINNAGQVVGVSYTNSSDHNAFLWATDVMTNLHPVVASTLPDTILSYANDISEDGKIVGFAQESSNNEYPLLWENADILYVLPTLNTDIYYGGYAFGISDNGDYIVGFSREFAGGGSLSCLWWSDSTGYTITNITGNFVDGSARAVNNYGKVTGGARIKSGDTYEVPVWGDISGLQQIDPGIGMGLDINNDGAIVGAVDRKAFLWHNLVITPLGFLTNTYGISLSAAQGINNGGSIVGNSYISQTLNHAVIWNNGTIIDLNSVSDLGVFDYLEVATDINDNGWIVGIGNINGKKRAFLAIPYQVEPTPTPAETPTMSIILPTSTVPAPTRRIFLPLVLRRWPPYPYTPTLNAIANPDGDGEYTVSWVESPTRLAATYVLQEATDAAFTIGLRTVCTVTNQNCQVTGKTAGTYYYRVKGTNEWGESAWSTAQTVVVLPPAVPVLNAIDNADGDGSFIVTWNAAARATGYTLEEATEPTFANPTAVFNGGQTSWTASGKTSGTYYYRVLASGPTGQSDWSATQSVSVQPPGAPYLNPISNSDSDGNYSVTWNAVSGATSYILQEDDNATFSSPQTLYTGAGQTWSAVNHVQGTYYYRVAAISTVGQSDWSNSQSTTVSSPADVRITHIEYDPPGIDLEGEYVRVVNFGGRAQAITGWTLRDAANTVFTFPTFTLAAGATVNVWVKGGTNTATDLYWGRNRAVWNNEGDTAYLRDTSGTLVSSYTYP